MRRIGNSWALLVVALLMAACVTDGGSPPNAGAPVTPAAVGETPVAGPGYLRFALSPSGAGDYYGWQFRVVDAATNLGFRPFSSGELSAGASLLAELWPDRYRIQVLLRGQVKRDEWVEVAGGRTTTIDVAIGVLVNSITTSAPTATGGMRPYAMEEHNIAQTYAPLAVPLRPGLEGRFHGPQIAGEPMGKGLLELVERGDTIARIELAEVGPMGFHGDMVFTDGRTVDAPMRPDFSFPDGAETRWPDGRSFTGRYAGLEPADGVLDWLDGSQWTGFLTHGTPRGPGRLMTADGTVFPEAPGADPTRFDGRFTCVTPEGISQECLYFSGERIASAAAHAALVEQRELARQQAAAKQAEHEPARPDDAACGSLAGVFGADGGLSRLSFDGKGRGELWQHTFLDTEPHTFEIDFSYAVAGGEISFDYGPAVYKDMNGHIVREKRVPGGTVACRFDGQVVAIGGKPYTRQR